MEKFWQKHPCRQLTGKEGGLEFPFPHPSRSYAHLSMLTTRVRSNNVEGGAGREKWGGAPNGATCQHVIQAPIGSPVFPQHIIINIRRRRRQRTVNAFSPRRIWWCWCQKTGLPYLGRECCCSRITCSPASKVTGSVKSLSWQGSWISPRCGHYCVLSPVLGTVGRWYENIRNALRYCKLKNKHSFFKRGHS